MNQDQVLSAVLEKHEPNTQQAYAVRAAVGTVYSGLEELAKYGHSFYLVEGTEHEAQDWPKMVYRDSEDGKTTEQKVVEDEEGLKALGGGWRDTPLVEMPKAPAGGPVPDQRPADVTGRQSEARLAKPGDSIDSKNTNAGDSKKG